MTDIETTVDGPSPRIIGWLVAVAMVVVVLVGVVLVIYTVRNADVAAQTRDLVRAQQAGQARADCRTTYNSARQQVIEHATAIANQANIDFAGFLLGDPRSGVDKLMTNAELLKAANQAVVALPTLDEMVEKGYRFDGEPAHPPCPVVK